MPGVIRPGHFYGSAEVIKVCQAQCTPCFWCSVFQPKLSEGLCIHGHTVKRCGCATLIRPVTRI